ncbi:MAG: 5-(carboxyamino)imidazole ribonucleotide synthase, partial [Candidatus Shapirobacteria bacterium]
PQSPAGQVSDKQIIADFNDEKAIIDVAKQSDFLTFEIENTNGKFLDKLEKKVSCIINPSGKSWRLFQDKLEQKKLFEKGKIPQPKYVPVESFSDLEKAAEELGFPLILKARFNAYDGRGNALIKEKNDLEKAWKKLNSNQLYAEEYVDFDKELAIMVARSFKGEIALYPIVETVQENNICHYVFAPAEILPKLKKKAIDLATKTIKLLEGAGVFGIEMFQTKDRRVLINEIAPRVHNSGHYTIEACITSQFEQHIRAVAGLPLGKTDMVVPAAVMINILGDRLGLADVQGLEKALAIPNVSVHIYNKKDTKPERKMGHITVIDKNISLAYKKAKLARKCIKI